MKGPFGTFYSRFFLLPLLLMRAMCCVGWRLICACPSSCSIMTEALHRTYVEKLARRITHIDTMQASRCVAIPITLPTSTALARSIAKLQTAARSPAAGQSTLQHGYCRARRTRFSCFPALEV